MDFDTLLTEYRERSFSERDKGARFEELMRRYLLTDPMYAGELEVVWLWGDFPFRGEFGGSDIGIDLVARTKTGAYWAVQCKCYAESTRITKEDVDTFLSASGKSFEDDMGEQRRFERRFWIATTDKWSDNADISLAGQEPPVTRIGLHDLRMAEIDWARLAGGESGRSAQRAKKTPRPHQKEAIEKARDYYKTHTRGQMISACGTGKTYTALKIVEEATGGNGFALFLVPSIALLNQTLREWMNDTEGLIYPVCICSDAKASRLREDDATEEDTLNMPYPATTNAQSAAQQIFMRFAQQKKEPGMVILFSTYQSIEVVQRALELLRAGKGTKQEFDIIVCDEAHRTTGVTLSGKDESGFVKVHDNDFLPARRRLYMTATPRLYKEEAKKKAKEGDAILCSMDDKELYGEEFFRLGFGAAVERGLLSDYKVLVLTVREDSVPPALQSAIADGGTEINVDAAAKLIGCINALSKLMIDDAEDIRIADPGFMHTALAFCRSIKDSKKITGIFNAYASTYYESLSEKQREEIVNVSSAHVDGGMDALQRQAKLDWLTGAGSEGKECRILTNVRCLSEGIDVPALDAVIFLSARNSQVDVVQSVGRVMRRPPKGNKKYGYIIIPVVVPAAAAPEEALEASQDFSIIWSVLNALRAHDDRFQAMVNKIELNKKKPGNIHIGPPGSGGEGPQGGDGTERPTYQTTLYFSELTDAIYARLVKKVGNKRYWEQWAADIAKIAERHKARIRELIEKDEAHHEAFFRFLGGLYANLNPNITGEEAIEMLAQHLITRPVFEALFEDDRLVQNNVVSRSMQKILDELDRDGMEKDREELEKFYRSVRERCEGVDNAEGRQKIIIELYDKFFKTALPKTVEKLGIVYTPVEVVDFILRSVDDVLKKEFGRSLSDRDVHILDPFTGTGTFITRLLQSGIIRKKDLFRKYTQELHANEIVLLAYYIASINIENAFHDLMREDDYTSFEGICLTDTFQLGEEGHTDHLFTKVFPNNSNRVMRQNVTPIRVIVGNPPYSVGQKSANDNAENEHYEHLEARIAETYAAGTKATLKNSLYDSYIKAFRWASDRIPEDEGGVIGFVTNAGWLDGAAMDGLRASFEKEFTSVYVFHLRGNQRTQGEQSRREGGKIFGSGSRAPIAITILVKDPKKKKDCADIFYHDIGDYLSREEKLGLIADFKSCMSTKFPVTVLRPNEKHDWLNQRNGIFESFLPLGDKKDKENSHTFFCDFYSNGLKTNRDAWCYNFSAEKVKRNIRRSIEYFNGQIDRYEAVLARNTDAKPFDVIKPDSKEFSWDRQQKKDVENLKRYTYNEERIYEGIYRPFTKSWCYFDRQLNNCVYQMPKLFPTGKEENLLICVSGAGVSKGFDAIMTNGLTDVQFQQNGQCFPLYYYEEQKQDMDSLFADGRKASYAKRGGVTDFILAEAQSLYGPRVAKEDIFYYVYGFLHLPVYRKTFAADLKKSLPRLFLVKEPKNFWTLSKAGRELAALHLAYESQDPPEGVTVTGEESGNYRVTKLRFAKKDDRSEILFNEDIRITGIPEAAYDYVVNGRSPIEWIMDRYQIKTDKASGITNDPNEWAKEHEDPRYILRLLLSVMTVAIKTKAIVESLPDVPME